MPPFFMAHKVDGVEVTGPQAKWSDDQALDSMADQRQFRFNAALTSTTNSVPATAAPPNYSVTGMPDGVTGFAGAGTSGPLGGGITLPKGDALGIAVAGGASSATTKTGAATVTVNGAGTGLTVDLTVTNGVGVTAAVVNAVGSGYLNNERVKVALADAGTTADAYLYALG